MQWLLHFNILKFQYHRYQEMGKDLLVEPQTSAEQNISVVNIKNN